ncbi:MAG: hypothetical protein J6K92_00775 [Oscillospiraceae bacterium]|nr:hypothetical protein [Oscillospiraceae bacterium]
MGFQGGLRLSGLRELNVNYTGLSGFHFLQEHDIRNTGLSREAVMDIAGALPKAYIESEFIEHEIWEE